MKIKKIAITSLVTSFLLVGCGGKTADDVVQLSKKKYKADELGTVEIKGKLDTDGNSTMTLQAKSDNYTINDQKFNLDGDKFTLKIEFGDDTNQSDANVTLYTQGSTDKYEKEIKVNLKDHIDYVYKKDEEEKKESAQKQTIKNERNELYSYEGKMLTELLPKIKELGYTATFAYQTNHYSCTDEVNKGDDEWLSGWKVTDIYFGNKNKKAINVYIKAV